MGGHPPNHPSPKRPWRLVTSDLKEPWWLGDANHELRNPKFYLTYFLDICVYVYIYIYMYVCVIVCVGLSENRLLPIPMDSLHFPHFNGYLCVSPIFRQTHTSDQVGELYDFPFLTTLNTISLYHTTLPGAPRLSFFLDITRLRVGFGVRRNDGGVLARMVVVFGGLWFVGLYNIINLYIYIQYIYILYYTYCLLYIYNVCVHVCI